MTKMINYEAADRFAAIEALSLLDTTEDAMTLMAQMQGIVKAVDKITNDGVSTLLKKWNVISVDETNTTDDIESLKAIESLMKHRDEATNFIIRDTINMTAQPLMNAFSVAGRTAQAMQNADRLLKAKLYEERNNK